MNPAQRHLLRAIGWSAAYLTILSSLVIINVGLLEVGVGVLGVILLDSLCIPPLFVTARNGIVEASAFLSSKEQP